MKCQFCDKQLIAGDSNIITFCDDDCLNDYCHDYMNDYNPNQDYEDRRQDLD